MATVGTTLASLDMTRFGKGIEHQGKRLEHLVQSLIEQSIEPLTFPCQADALRVMLRTPINIKIYGMKVDN